MEYFLELTDWLDKFTIWVAVITLFFSARTWWHNRKQNTDIEIILSHNHEQYLLPQTIKRKHLTRSEVQGVLGAIYRARTGNYYTIAFLAEKAFSKRLESAQESKTERLIIDIDTRETFEHFIVE